MSLTETNLDDTLPLLGRGKVRDIYQIDPSTLLFVATDRISAYDVIMENGITDKGKLLTKLSEFWFDFLPIENHLIKKDIFQEYPRLEKYRDQLQDRALIVRKLKLIPLEVIVRGYITGSAWKEYKKLKTVHGLPIDEELVESQEFKTPIFTPLQKQNKESTMKTSRLLKLPRLLGKIYATDWKRRQLICTYRQKSMPKPKV